MFFERMFPLAEKSHSTVPVSGLTESALKAKLCMLSVRPRMKWVVDLDNGRE